MLGQPGWNFLIYPQKGEEMAQQIKSKAPGTVKAIKVAVGDAVKADQVIVVMEAMKMEMPMPATADGVVKAILVEAGARVNPGVVLVEIE